MGGRILIVGGGIAGLTLAAALRDGPHAVELIERAPSWSLVGAGIGIGVNGMAAIARLGLADAVAARGETLNGWEIQDRAGELLHRYDFAPFIARFGVSTVSIHRGELHEVLLAAAGQTPIRLGLTLADLRQAGDRVEARFSDGGAGSFDLVIGADGIRSQVRELVFGPADLTYSGQTSFRCVVNRSPGIDCLIEIWGDRSRVGMSPISPSQTYCYATLSTGPCDTVEPERDFELFRREFAGFGGHFRHIYEQVGRPDQLIRTDISELIGQDWLRGRVLLIGDAAHAITPNLGQGGVLAIQDAVALGEILAREPDWDAALAAYVEARSAAVQSTQDRSRIFGELAHIAGEPDLAAFRDRLIRGYGQEMMTRIVMGQYL